MIFVAFYVKVYYLPFLLTWLLLLLGVNLAIQQVPLILLASCCKICLNGDVFLCGAGDVPVTVDIQNLGTDDLKSFQYGNNGDLEEGLS